MLFLAPRITIIGDFLGRQLSFCPWYRGEIALTTEEYESHEHDECYGENDTDGDSYLDCNCEGG